MNIETSLSKTIEKYDNTLSLLGSEHVEEKLDYNDILYIHSHIITQYGGIDGIRDQNLLQSVILNPYQVCFDTQLFPTIFDKAAKLLYDFCNYQIFLDGNKRTGVVVSNTLLLMNQYELLLSEIDMYQLAMDIATHQITLEHVATLFKENSKINIKEQISERSQQPETIQQQDTEYEYDSR